MATFPLSVHSSGRYLVAADGRPWRIQYDSASLVPAIATPAQLDTYLLTRRAQGFNTLWMKAMTRWGSYTAATNFWSGKGYSNGGSYNYNGDKAFTTNDDFSTPGTAYWNWVENIIDRAAVYGIVIALSPCYIGYNAASTHWAGVLSAMTQQQSTNWGTWIGTRFASKPNIFWNIAGDYTPSVGSALETNTVAIIAAIKAAGASQLTMAELGDPDSIPTTANAAIGAYVDMASYYGYGANRDGAVQSTANTAARLTPLKPVWVQEPGFEYENNTGGFPANTSWGTRRTRWWNTLAGGIAGDGFGSRDAWQMVSFPSCLSTPGAQYAHRAFALLDTLPWYDLRPSGTGTGFAGKTLITSGAGTFSSTNAVVSAVTGTGSHLLAYIPGTNGGSGAAAITVDMTAMSGKCTARWWNPVTGIYTDIGTGYANTGTREFTTSGSNGDGNDWLLVLTANYELPSDRATAWKPGITYNGGIPTTFVKYGSTLTPSGNDDLSQIQTAVDAAGTAAAADGIGRYVLLSAGTFNISGAYPVFLGKSRVILRGSGAGVTYLHRTDGAVDGSNGTNANCPTVIATPAGNRWTTGPSTGYALTATGAHGDYAVTVTGASSGTFVPGQIVLIDEEANQAYVAQPADPYDPDTGLGPDGHGTNILQSDDGLLTWAAWDPENNPGGIQEDARVDVYSRSGRITAEYKEVLSWNSATGVLTFSSPIHAQYRLDHSAEVCPFSSGNEPIKYVGVEDMTINRGDNGNVYFQNIAYGWLKGVELTSWLGEGIRFLHCFRTEIRDSFIHTPVYFWNGGGSYNIAIDNASSEILVENCISRLANKVIVARGAGAGSVVAYNYMDDAREGDSTSWQGCGVGGSHYVGPNHMLFEGNWGYNADNDKTHGNSWGHTYLRNHLTARRTTFEASCTGRAASVTRTTKKMSFVGNVLGLSGQVGGLDYESHDQSNDAIWRMGWDDWNPYRWDGVAVADTIRDGNYDYVTAELRWHGLGGSPSTTLPDISTIPISLYLTSSPSFFGVNQWPWVTPEAATKIYTVPAKVRYDAGNPNGSDENTGSGSLIARAQGTVFASDLMASDKGV
jgi:hypothetical protein